jgi:hypothetical protein
MAMELAGHCVGIFCRNQSELFERLTATINERSTGECATHQPGAAMMDS